MLRDWPIGVHGADAHDGRAERGTRGRVKRETTSGVADKSQVDVGLSQLPVLWSEPAQRGVSGRVCLQCGDAFTSHRHTVQAEWW